MKPYTAIFWSLFATAITVYLTMVFWSLPRLQEMAGGLVAFDLRPMGYSLPEARSLVSALGKAGSDFYLNVQLWLDTAYPGLLAAVLMMAFHKLASGPFAWLLEAGAVLTELFDYLENHAIAEMLRAGPDTLTEVMVESASNWTLLKSASSTLIFSALLFLLLRFAWHWFRHSKSQ